jgi:LmeA-like phospholipid-binding
MRRLVIGGLVVAGLLVAADFGAAAVAESAVSRQMREQIGLVDDPSVRINGFPFLAQAVVGEYRSIDVDADRIAVGALRDVEVRAQLRGVAAPLGELLGSGPRTVRVEEADGTVRIGADDLERLLPGIERVRIETVDEAALENAADEGGDASLAALDPRLVARLVGTTTVLGDEVEVAVIAALELSDGMVQIVPRDIRLGDADAAPLPAPVQELLGRTFRLRLNPGELPLQVTPTKLRARDGVLEISGTADDLVLGGVTAPATAGG